MCGASVIQFPKFQAIGSILNRSNPFTQRESEASVTSKGFLLGSHKLEASLTKRESEASVTSEGFLLVSHKLKASLMDLFDELLSNPGVSSRTGSKFKPKMKPRPRKQTLATQLCTLSQDKKETISDAKSCYDGRENTESIRLPSQLPVIEENNESEDGLLLATATSDSISCSHPPSVESAKKVDSMQFDFGSCASILPSDSTIHGPVGEKSLTDDTQNSGTLNYSTPSASTAHEATVLDQSGLESIQTDDTHFIDGKISGENIDIFYELECLDDFHNQPENEADSANLKQSTISCEDGDLEIEEGGTGADIAMNTISSGGTTLEKPACKYIPKTKMRTAKEDTCREISEPEISNMHPPSPLVNPRDTRCVHDVSIGAHSDGILNDSSINIDGYTPANQDTEEPVNVESLALDSYGDILVDDFNSDEQDEMSRELNVKSGEEKPSMESNISQPQEVSSIVGEEIDHSKTSRKLRKKVSHQHDDVDENGNFSNEPLKEGKSQGKKTSTKSSKPSSDNEKQPRKRKKGNKEVPDSQAEKHPKKFSHSTRRNKRQVNKVLLETPEDDIDFQKISFKDLIIYHEYKEKLEKKEASTRKSATNQRTDNVGEEVYNDGEESLASEQGRGTDDDETPDVVDMTSAYYNYQSFMNKTSRTKWSKHDTEHFYEAVRQFGTDFCMIQQLFPSRTRHQIKLKFKNEERHHPFRLSDALTNRSTDHSHFLSLIEKLKEASKEKQESYQDELTENTGDEELQELSPESNEEVAKPEGEVEGTEKEECVGEIHSPLKADESDDEDDDPNKWDDYNFDF